MSFVEFGPIQFVKYDTDDYQVIVLDKKRYLETYETQIKYESYLSLPFRDTYSCYCNLYIYRELLNGNSWL